MGKAGFTELNPTRCENVKRLLLVRRRNTIYVLSFFWGGGWELCFNWGTFKEGLVHTVRIQLNSDQPTWVWVQVPRRSHDGAMAKAGTVLLYWEQLEELSRLR